MKHSPRPVERTDDPLKEIIAPSPAVKLNIHNICVIFVISYDIL